jgi:TPR repeat protein
MVLCLLHQYLRLCVQVTTPRGGIILATLWMGWLAGCTSTGPYRAVPPPPLGHAMTQTDTTPEAPGAVHTLRQQAVQGDGEAQYRLGIMSHTGEGVPQNETDAVQWLQRAATQGHPEAQRLLGRMYLSGQGVPRNEAEAAYWYRQAADQGDPEAQWQLGRMYLSGQGVQRNEAEAVYWYRRAADQGDPEIQWQLGLKYLHGLGVPQDVVQAYLWLSLAAAHLPPGKPRDNATRAWIRAAQQMTPAQWARAQELVSQWQPRKAP